MKIKCKLAVRRAVCLLAGSLAAWIQTAEAQQGFGIEPGGGGTFVQRIERVGAQGGVGIVVNGRDVKAMLMNAFDTNHDDVVTSIELNATLAAWFQQADTDTNGAVTANELVAALKGVFPEPVPSPGFPAPPDERLLHNLFARKLMAAGDADKDGSMTFQEVTAYVTTNFSGWDSDSSGALDASECTIAFARLTGPDESDGAIIHGGPGFRTRSFRLR